MHHTWASNITLSYTKLKQLPQKDTLLPSS
jgi:hypothetical protein